ncbi:MAG: hypothetical protein HRT36_05195 [Alphaproteobacteria bacterium]|nr:hypothetical protein [Alphaproteobacteria bacterium]
MSESIYTRQQATALGMQDPRQTEAYALIEIARRMDQVRQREESDRAELVGIFQLNWRLWTIFQSELSNPDNLLPDEIKVNMLQLSNFIDKHTIEQIREPSRKGLEVLININRQVGAGLLGDQGQGLDEVQNTRLRVIKDDPTVVAATEPKVAAVEETTKPKPKFRTKKVSK